eukprot:g17831.t1
MASSEQVDFQAEIIKDTNMRVYGVGSVLPKWVVAAIDFGKENADDALEEKNAAAAKEVIALRAHFKKQEASDHLLMPGHLRDLYAKKSLRFIEAMGRRAAARFPETAEKADDIVSIVDRTRQGLMHKGHLPPTGFWRAQKEDFLKSQEEAAELAAAEPPSRPPAEHWCPEEDIEEMWRQTQKHIDSGLWRVVAFSDEDKARDEKGHPIAFPVHQHGRVRVCVDFRKKNRRVIVHEKMRLVGVRGAIEIISRLLSPHSTHLALIQHKDDVTADTNLEKADREVLREVLASARADSVRADAQRAAAAVQKRDASDRSRIMPFRELMVASDNSLLDLFLELSGFDQAPEKHECHSLRMQRILTVLGVAYTLEKFSDGISLSIAAEKIQRLHHMGNTLLVQFKTKSVDFDLLLSFRGLCRHSAQLNLQLAHIVRGLDKWAEAEQFNGWIKQRKFRQSLRRLTRTLLFLQRKQVSRRLAPKLLDMPTAHLYTDASLEDMQSLNEKLRKGDHGAIKAHGAWIGGVIVLPCGKRRAFRIQVTSLPKHVNYCHIGILEFLALRVATRIFSREMKCRYTVAHIDNLASVYISIRGTSTCSVTQNLCASWIEECISQNVATYSFAPSDAFAREFVCEMSDQGEKELDTYQQEAEEYRQNQDGLSSMGQAISAIRAKSLSGGVNFLPFSEVLSSMIFHAGLPKRVAFNDVSKNMQDIMRYGCIQKVQTSGGVTVPMPVQGVLPAWSVVTPPAVFNDHLLLHNKEAIEIGHQSTCAEISHRVRLEKTEFDKKISGIQLKLQGMLIGDRHVQPTEMRPPSAKQLRDGKELFTKLCDIVADKTPGLIARNEGLECIKLLYLFLNACADELDGQYLSWADWRMKYSLEILFELNFMSLRRNEEGGISAVTAKNEVCMDLFDSKGNAPGKQ